MSGIKYQSLRKNIFRYYLSLAVCVSLSLVGIKSIIPPKSVRICEKIEKKNVRIGGRGVGK